MGRSTPGLRQSYRGGSTSIANVAPPGFTQTYGVKRLFWYGTSSSIHDAITTEKRIKRWRRAWKIDLIEKMNPQWLDLYETLNS